MITIIGWSLLYPSKIPAAEPSVSLLRKIRASGHLIPIVLLIIGVIGSIYVGIATATEAAAVGVAGALLLSAVTGRSEEHTSELQSLMRISYAVFCLETKKHSTNAT